MAIAAYVSSPKFILNADSIFSGKVKSVLIPDEQAIDIDTILDFKFAQFLINERDRL